jgi:hypothetical protein
MPATASPIVTVDLSKLPARNLACLSQVASLRGVTVGELVASMIQEDTTRILTAVASATNEPQPTQN